MHDAVDARANDGALFEAVVVEARRGRGVNDRHAVASTIEEYAVEVGDTEGDVEDGVALGEHQVVGGAVVAAERHQRRERGRRPLS